MTTDASSQVLFILAPLGLLSSLYHHNPLHATANDRATHSHYFKISFNMPRSKSTNNHDVVPSIQGPSPDQMAGAEHTNTAEDRIRRGRAYLNDLLQDRRLMGFTEVQTRSLQGLFLGGLNAFANAPLVPNAIEQNNSGVSSLTSSFGQQQMKEEPSPERAKTPTGDRMAEPAMETAPSSMHPSLTAYTPVYNVSGIYAALTAFSKADHKECREPATRGISYSPTMPQSKDGITEEMS